MGINLGDTSHISTCSPRHHALFIAMVSLVGLHRRHTPVKSIKIQLLSILETTKRDILAAWGEQHKIMNMQRPTTVSPLACLLPFTNTPAVRLPLGAALWQEAGVCVSHCSEPAAPLWLFTHGRGGSSHDLDYNAAVLTSKQKRVCRRLFHNITQSLHHVKFAALRLQGRH